MLVHGSSDPLWMAGGAGLSRWSLAVPDIASRHYGNTRE
jgi:hypothetical protein